MHGFVQCSILTTLHENSSIVTCSISQTTAIISTKMNLNSRMTLLSLVLDSSSTAFCQVPCPVLVFRLTYNLQLITCNLVWERDAQWRFASVSDTSHTGLTTSTSTWACSTRQRPFTRSTTCHFYHWLHRSVTNQPTFKHSMAMVNVM